MQTEHLTVNGMTCGGCVTGVTEAPTAIPGVGGIEVVLPTGKVNVSYDEGLADPVQMTSAVERAGYTIGATQVDAASKSKGYRC